MTCPERGTSADFFVHPDFHRLRGGKITSQIEQYEESLHATIDRSPLPILIYNPDQHVGQGDFWDRFPEEQRFPSMMNRGCLESNYEVIGRFNGLIEEQVVLKGVVHGSYLEQCVQGFKESLQASGNTSILRVYWPAYTAPAGTVRHPETVRYGTVLFDSSIRARGPLHDFGDLHSDASQARYARGAQIFRTGTTS